MTDLPKLHDGARDFDFLMGTYQVRNRRLIRRLDHCTEWDTFPATNVAAPLLGGMGNQDEFRTDYWPAFIGMTLRFYCPATGQWAIYWVDNKRGILEPPVFGSFTNGVGVFEGTDILHGRPIRVRFTWSGGSTGSPRWEQAFSPDDGKTWETNWVMEFSR